MVSSVCQVLREQSMLRTGWAQRAVSHSPHEDWLVWQCDLAGALFPLYSVCVCEYRCTQRSQKWLSFRHSSQGWITSIRDQAFLAHAFMTKHLTSSREFLFYIESISSCLCVCVHAHMLVHKQARWRSEDSFQGLISLAPWVPGMEIGFSVFHNRCRYLLSYLASPHQSLTVGGASQCILSQLSMAHRLNELLHKIFLNISHLNTRI